MRTPSETADHMEKQRGLVKAREWAHLHIQETDTETSRKYWREVAQILDARKTPQEKLDAIYAEGKRAYLKDEGTHGPTLKVRPLFRERTLNPYICNTKEHLAWERGYNQDTRRVIA